MLIDTHCHLTSPDLAPQIDAVLQRARETGVGRMITVATSPADASAAMDLMRDRPSIYLAAGIHPHQAGQCTADARAALTALHSGRGWAGGSPPRLVAVGETGLDHHYDFAPRDVQEDVFRFQLALAIEVGRPVIIHARESEERVCEILADYPKLVDRVVFHCFSGGVDLARRILDTGFWLSFTGVVTFKNAETIRAAARYVPKDRIMVETDCPYMSPEPVRKIRPCEPAFVVHTARFLADIRGERFEDFAAASTANAVRFFGLPGGGRP